MTKFANKTFSVACSSGGISQDELDRRWAETFGKQKADCDCPQPCSGCIKHFDECMACEHMMPTEDGNAEGSD